MKKQITRDQLNPNPLDGLPIQEPRPFSDFCPREDQAAITIKSLTYHPSFISTELTIDGVNYEVVFWCVYDKNGNKKRYEKRTCTTDQPIYENINNEALDRFAEMLTNISRSEK